MSDFFESLPLLKPKSNFTNINLVNPFEVCKAVFLKCGEHHIIQTVKWEI